MALRLNIHSSNLVTLSGLASADGEIDDATVTMSLYRGTPLHPVMGIAVKEVQSLIPNAPVTVALPFTSGGTTEIVVGNTITGMTDSATATIKTIILDSGTWAGGDATGTFTLTNVIGTFNSSELLDTADDANLATTNGAPVPQTFTLICDGAATAAIDGDATIAEVQAALEALLGAGKITVKGDNFNIDPTDAGMIFTWDESFGDYPIIVIVHDDLVGPSSFAADELTEGQLAGVATDKGAGEVGIPIEGHTLEVGDFIRIAGTKEYDAQYTVNSIVRDKIGVTATYAAEEYTGDEDVYIGVTNGKDIAFTPVGSDGDYTALLPANLAPVLLDEKYKLFVTAVKDAATMVLVADVTVVHYGGE